MNKFKKALALLLCGASMFSVVACGGNGGENASSGTGTPGTSQNKTVIKVQNFPGGVGVKWLQNAAKAFEEKYENEHFEEGKTGVYIDIDPSQPDSNTLNTSGNHIIFDERYSNIYSLAQSSSILPLTDLVTAEDENGTSLEDRISSKTLEGLKGADGEYYALPHYEWFPGLIYDKEAFDKNGWYIAKDATGAKEYESKYGNLYLTGDASAKSCGPDAVYGTDDDGLPTSLQELLVLSSYINRTYAPFTLSGQFSYYANYFVEGLWASLAGYEELSAVYNFKGEVEVVTGYTDENLFQGINYIKKPKTEKVTITPENGYLAFESATRYYSTAFLQILRTEGFFTADATDGTVSHTAAQDKFIRGGMTSKIPARAFIMEGSYWYNESVDVKNFENYFSDTQKTTRDVRFMPLPKSVNTPVAAKAEGETPDKATLIDNGIAYAYINARFKNDTDIVEACKKFLEFVYSDEQLRAFTALTGVTRPIDYELSSTELAGLSSYQQSVYNLSRNSDILYFSSKSETFKKNQGKLKIHFSASLLRPKLDNTEYTSYFQAIGDGYSAKSIMEATAFSASEWSSMVKES